MNLPLEYALSGTCYRRDGVDDPSLQRPVKSACRSLPTAIQEDLLPLLGASVKMARLP
jgi:hypothetical protein